MTDPRPGAEPAQGGRNPLLRLVLAVVALLVVAYFGGLFGK